MRLRAAAMLGAGALALGSLGAPADSPALPAPDEIRARLGAYARVSLQADLSTLGAREREALGKLVTAVHAADAIYWKQMGPQAEAARARFAAAADPVAELYRDFIAINYGPFDIRDGHGRFVDAGGEGPRPPGAGFYPPDLTRDEFEALLARHPELRADFERATTLIRRVDGVLVAIPYERFYLDELKAAARALQEAAVLVGSPSLRRYLSLRAEALLHGDFYASDLAWLEVRDNLLDVVIGPIETHDDALLGLKASYEAAALVKDVPASRMVEVYRSHLESLWGDLPVDGRFRNGAAGADNVPEIVNVIRFGGDFNAGVKTVAASLPNDERVTQEKGAKKQIYRNVLEAKFDALLEPLARLILPKKDWPLVTREALLTNVVLHELSHAQGVDYVAGAGDLTVRRALKERFAAIEEAKADVLGIVALRHLERREILSEDEVREGYATYLAALFRTARLGPAEAHGLAATVQINVLLRAGGIERDARRGEIGIRPKALEAALATLAVELLEIAGTGDYARAGALLAESGRLDEATAATLERAAAVPADVVFTYPL